MKSLGGHNIDSLNRFYYYSGSLLKFLKHAKDGVYPYKVDKVHWYVNNNDFDEILFNL